MLINTVACKSYINTFFFLPFTNFQGDFDVVTGLCDGLLKIGNHPGYISYKDFNTEEAYGRHMVIGGKEGEGVYILGKWQLGSLEIFDFSFQ